MSEQDPSRTWNLGENPRSPDPYKQVKEEPKQTELETSWLYVAGPLFLLCTLAIAGRMSFMGQIYLLIVAFIGMLLCAKYKIRGWISAVLFFGLLAAIHHGFFTSDHLWNFGLESSLACGLLITALSFDQRSTTVRSLQDQSNMRQATIAHLEEDLLKLTQSSQLQQVALSEKLSEKHKELDDLQGELSSIFVLNEVLRKTSARQVEESERISESALEKDRRIGTLLVEIDDLQNELARVSNLSGLSLENSRLLQELNGARSDKAQSHLINETLVRLHAKEVHKAQEASEKLHAIHAEKMQITEMLGASKRETEMLNLHLQQTAEELQKSLTALKQTERVHSEKSFLQERLQMAEMELASLSKRKPVAEPPAELLSLKTERDDLLGKLAAKEVEVSQLMNSLQGRQDDLAKTLSWKEKEAEELIVSLQGQRDQLAKELSLKEAQAVQQIRLLQTERDQLLEQLSHQKSLADRDAILEKLSIKEGQLTQIEERLKSASETEALYRQLRTQFEEKSAVLHETRAKLFHADTQLQKLLIEQEQHLLQAEPLSPEFRQEILDLEKEVLDLTLENEQLQEIISSLSR